MDDLSPAPVKKLSLKEVARRFEQGDASALQDYRTFNLRESSEQLQQTLLQSMPKGKTLMKELVKLIEELQGRVAGRNSEDASQIKEGLIQLQAQWKSIEQSAKQAAKELTESAAATAATNDAHFQARIDQVLSHAVASVERENTMPTQLEDECSSLQDQVAERDATIQQLKQQADASCSPTSDQKWSFQTMLTEVQENHSPMRDSSNFGGGEQQAASPAASPARRSPFKRYPTLSTLGEEAASPALVRTLSIVGSARVGHTLSVVAGDRAAPDNLPLQWLCAGPADSQLFAISGAVRHTYSPEVADVGCTILCRVGGGRDAVAEGDSNVLRSASPVTAEPGVEEEAAKLEAAGGASFFVVPVQHKGVVQRKRTVAALRVDAEGLAVSAAGKDIAAAGYHADMQVCGARGGGDGAAQGMFLAMNAHHVFMLALETPWKRNVCISLVRKMAEKHGLRLEGPQESS